MDKKEALIVKQKRMEAIRPIVTKGFSTDKELDDFKRSNQSIFNEYYKLYDEIQQLKYELMSPKEQAEHDEFLRKLKLKAEGKKFW